MTLLPRQPERTVVLQDQALRRLQGFTQVPNAVLRHPSISYGAKLTFGVLLSYAWQDDFCWPAQERLAKDMQCSIRQVQRFLVELRASNFLTWKQQGLNRPNVYYILPQTKWAMVPEQSRPDTTELSSPDTTSMSGLEATPMSDKEDSKKNTHVDNVDESISGKGNGKERPLSREEYTEARGLALHIQDTIGQPENFASYFARAAEAVRRGPRGVQALMEVLSHTKDAKLSGRLRKTASQYFHRTWQRVLPTLGQPLSPRPRSSSQIDDQERDERIAAKLAVQEFLARPRMREENERQRVPRNED